MKWKRRKPTPLGAKRTVRKFAWLPTACGEYMVWFGYYFVEEIQCKIRDSVWDTSWDDWQEVSRRLG